MKLSSAQLPFDVAVLHKHVVMEVAMGAAVEEKKPLLGVLYDELARCECVAAACMLHVTSCVRSKQWEDRASKLGAGFCVKTAASSLSETILKRARTLHDVLFAATPARAERTGRQVEGS